MRLAFVIQRYGSEIRGGAEQGCRQLAEHLAQLPGWEVSVFTTCALDATTWADHYPPGTTVEAGVAVHRFRSTAGRHPDFDRYSRKVMEAPRKATPEEAARWIEMQGPVCPDVIDAAAASDADVIAFYPYLYYPTVHGLPRVADRAVLHAAAHDEPPIRLPLFKPVFEGAQGLVFHTEEERRLVHSLFTTRETPELVLGLGVAAEDGSATTFRALAGLRDDEPYVLTLGRVDDGKGALLLARFFATYKQRRPGPLKLVFSGPVVDAPPAHPDIVVTGPIDDDAKWGAYRGASVLVHPSPFESFSIVLMEAWSVGTPVMVNANCSVTVEHARLSSGGLVFDGYATFEASLDRLVGDATLRAAMGENGRRYVDERYAWPVVVDRYSRFVERIVERRALLAGR